MASPQPQNNDGQAPATSASLWRRCTAAIAGLLLAAVLIWLAIMAFTPLSRTPPRSPAGVSRADITAAIHEVEASEQARDELRQEQALLALAEYQPGVVEWHARLARLHARQGRFVEAAAGYQAALLLSPDADEERDLRVRLAQAAIQLGNAADARAALEPLLEESPVHAWVPPLWAKVLRLEGDSAQARDYLETAIPPTNRHGAAWQLLGLLEFDLKNYRAALGHFQEAVRSQPGSEFSHFKLAECARLLGDRELARQHRAEYQRLNALQEEMDRLLQARFRQQTLTPAETDRLDELYRALGQSDQGPTEPGK